jgi:hypothetical protein
MNEKIMENDANMRRAEGTKDAPLSCRACVVQLFRKIYKNCWWFPLVREPLLAGMRFLALVNGIRASGYAPHHPECSGCIRFVKAELYERSFLFRILDGMIGPRFRKLRDARLDQEDMAEAVRTAEEMMKLMQDQPSAKPEDEPKIG